MLMRRLVPALATCVVLARPLAAHAQAPAAEALFTQGRAALAAGDLEIACARFRESDRLDPAPGTKANIGECEEKRGRLASAWEAYRAAIEKLPRDDKRVGLIQARIAALEPRLPRLVLVLAPGAPRETTVKDGDVTLGAGAFGAPLPMDPGVRHLVVGAPGRASRTIDVTLVEGRTVTITVEPGSAAAGSSSAETTGSSPGPWIVGGIGIAGLVVGAVTGAIVLQKKGVTNAECSDVTKTCTPDGRAAADAGRVLGPVTTTALVVGAAGLVAGGIWLGVSRAGKTSARFGVGPVVGGAAWRMEGSW